MKKKKKKCRESEALVPFHYIRLYPRLWYLLPTPPDRLGLYLGELTKSSSSHSSNSFFFHIDSSN